MTETVRTKVIKGKNKGTRARRRRAKFNCLSGTGTSNVITVSDGLP